MHITILPGWQQNCTHWEPIITTLTSQGITVECLDILFAPGSSDKTKYTDIASVAEAVVSKIQGYDEPTLLVGHSFGGRVAAYIAAKSTVELKGLVLIGSPNLYRPSLKTRCIKALAKSMQRMAFLLPAQIKARLRSEDYTQALDTQYEALFRNIINDDQYELLTLIHVPTLAIWGEFDEAVPLHVGKEIANIVQNAQLKILKNLGHNVHMEKSSLLANTLIQYAKSL